MTASRTIVIAPRIDDAKAWCYTHGVAPHGRNTHLRSTRDSLHGLTFHTGDWLIVLPGHTEWTRMLEALAPVLLTAPAGDDVITNLERWWAAEARPATFEHVFGHAD